MRNPIYEPKGEAKEYADFALNIYTGCNFRCFYCYCPGIMRKKKEEFHSNVQVRNGIIEATNKQLQKWENSGIKNRTIHLCFIGDPFPNGHKHNVTLQLIKLLKSYGHNIQILTKNYNAIFEHQELLNILDKDDCFGITYDGGNNIYQNEEECFRNASLCLKEVKDNGKCKTWVSFEPVVNGENVLNFIERNHGNIDNAKIGKLNHFNSDVNWKEFGNRAEKICEEKELNYMIKNSLKKEM